MLGENNKLELQRLSEVNMFTASESRLIDFIIQNGRVPNYIDERKEYQVLLRLNKKLKSSKEKVMILSNLFQVIDDVKVSNKLVGRSVD